MVYRPALCSHALPAALLFGLPLLIVEGGCTGDRPTFGTWDDSDGDGGESLDAAFGDTTIPNDAEHTPATEYDSSDSSSVLDADTSAAAHTSTTRDEDPSPRSIDADQTSMSGTSAPQLDAGGVADGGAVGEGATDVSAEVESDSATAACNEAIANGVTLNGSNRALLESTGTPIDHVELLYISELELYAVAFERGLSGTGLVLATFDEQGDVINQPASLTSPLLDESRFDKSPSLAWNGSGLGLLLQADDPRRRIT